MFKWNFKCGTCIVSSVMPSSIHSLNQVFFCTMLVSTKIWMVLKFCVTLQRSLFFLAFDHSRETLTLSATSTTDWLYTLALVPSPLPSSSSSNGVYSQLVYQGYYCFSENDLYDSLSVWFVVKQEKLESQQGEFKYIVWWQQFQSKGIVRILNVQTR